MNALNQLFTELANRLEDKINPSSKHLRFFQIELLFKTFNLQDSLNSLYEGEKVFIPMERGTCTAYKMTNRSGLSQLESRIVVPTKLAEDSGLPYNKYEPNHDIYIIGVDDQSSFLENLK
ncbi:hypothetical protein KY358_04845 [Candidatus Woesearchaeota archaeon]|nr:hypothetical protein [Candidatus Woesearchaeota archaeon]